jgi:beta-mannosidase
MIYHDLLPKIVKRELPQMFYWPSSPFSENYENPTSAITGDQHPWSVGLGSADFYRYRTRVDRFPTEGGFLGASSPATLRQFLPKYEQYVNSMSWIHHDNFYYRDEIIPFWFGKTHEQITFDDYAFASALLQAEALSEYIANYHRRKFSSSSAIFWMFKDGWPASHGWAIVDYYDRKKLAYHPVRRGFEPISVVVADDGEKINIYGINDAMTEWEGKLQYGVFRTGGDYVIKEDSKVKLPANASTIIGSFEKGVFEKAGYTNHSAFAVLKNNDDIPVSQHRMLMAKFKDMQLEKPKISIQQKGDYAILSSPVFVWGVCLDIDGESPVNDNCFDLFPGIPYYVKLNKGEKVSVQQTGNDLMLKLK